MSEEIAIGRIRKTHGVKGYLKINSFSGEYDHFYNLDQLTLKNNGRTKVFQVEKVVPLSGEILLKLEGVDNPETGKLLAGWEIWVPREFAAKREKDEYYHADLTDCELLYEGEVLGRVLAVLDSGADDLIEVSTENGRKLIPFNTVFIKSVDTDKKLIELAERWILD